MFLNGFKVESCKILDEFCIRWLGIYSRQNRHSLNDFYWLQRRGLGLENIPNGLCVVWVKFMRWQGSVCVIRDRRERINFIQNPADMGNFKNENSFGNE